MIGFSGKIGCGKSTVCAILERLLKERMGLKVETISFGTILKQKVAEAFRWIGAIRRKGSPSM
jgi:dephospho-CoA kinase